MHMVPHCMATYPKSSPYFMTFTWDDAASNQLSTSVSLQSDNRDYVRGHLQFTHTHTQPSNKPISSYFAPLYGT